MGRTLTINIDLFKEQVLLVVGKQWEDVEPDLVEIGAKKRFFRFVKNAMSDPANKRADAYAAHSGRGTLLVMPEYKKGTEWAALLVHELNHVVYFISKKRGMLDEMEAMAHLQEWLFTAILGLMDKEEG